MQVKKFCCHGFDGLLTFKCKKMYHIICDKFLINNNVKLSLKAVKFGSEQSDQSDKTNQAQLIGGCSMFFLQYS